MSLYDRYIRLHQALRRIRARYILLGALCLASLIIVIALPSRWEGGSDLWGTEYYVPLRPMTAAEAAFLLHDHSAYITHLTPKTVTLASSYFVKTIIEPGNRQQYSASTASDDYYYGEYHISRPELEAALGRTLSSQDISAYQSLNTDTPERTFSPSDVWKYIVIELLVLSALLTGVILAVQRIQSPWYIVHPFTIAQMILIVFVPFYAPALLDYDYFFQRVVLEFIWFDIADYTFLPSLCISLFCLVSVCWKWLRKRIVEQLHHRTDRLGPAG